jgi:DNA topoisomerase I
MAKALIIVESPAKIKTLKKLLGSNYDFSSSVGHIRDLPQRSFGVDLENDFEPQYEVLEDKKKVIQELIKKAKTNEHVFLSPDPDREGEAIAWHIASLLPKGVSYSRVTFNSITKEAVEEALRQPREIDQDLVDAQQARRLLDRMVGYSISPLLSRRVKRQFTQGLSAGRVQSVALKLVVDREKEIEAFNPVEYWNLHVWFNTDTSEHAFRSYVYSVGGLKVVKENAENNPKHRTISNETDAKQIKEILENSSYLVKSVEKKEKKRNPVPPFITSTLQQEASRYWGFSSSRTMGIAQGLYEGIDMGSEGQEGLITYMRTDSVRIAPEAITESRAYIKEQYGASHLPEKPNSYASKKSAQDAHEAIRPTNLNHPPESIKNHLTQDQFKLYSLIWRRFIASQMKPAIYDTVTVVIDAESEIVLRATGSTLKFNGFLAVYEEKNDDDEKAKEEGKILPPLEAKQSLNKEKIDADQSFTKPPPRYSEASLVKELEKSGIGRPSTYASIMNKIQSRDYTLKESNRLKPTELGRLIAQWLETHFTQIMDAGFTAKMEDDLELIADSGKPWKTIIRDFWKDFEPTLRAAEEDSPIPKTDTDLKCPKCDKILQKIWARSKYFYGCSGYPDCDYTSAIEAIAFDKEEYAEGFDWDQKCSKCEKDMTLRHGRFGPFLGCSNYPDCRGIVNIPKKGETIYKDEDLPACPAKGCDGRVSPRKSRFGKTFFSCSTFPECNVIVNDLDDLSQKYADHTRTAYEKKTKKKGKAAAGKKSKKTTTKKAAPKKKRSAPVGPNYKASESLDVIIGSEPMTRGQVTKKVWEYIKKHDLQSPDNKRLIVPDESLAKVFGTKEGVDMFKMTGLISPHLEKI